MWDVVEVFDVVVVGVFDGDGDDFVVLFVVVVYFYECDWVCFDDVVGECLVFDEDEYVEGVFVVVVCLWDEVVV